MKNYLVHLVMDSFKDTFVNQYKVLEHIGSGSFGNVFKAEDTRSGELVALKIPIDVPERNNQEWIVKEYQIYKKLSDPAKGVVDVKMIQKRNKKIMVMNLLGDSLSGLMVKHSKFHLKTVILLAIEMIKSIKHVHSRGYLHRDIKPDNFTIGHDKANKLYCIDFGLATKFQKKNGDHLPQEGGHKFLGTARYASINAHLGNTQSRKDDLEAIGYLLVYFYMGKLPWQGIRCSNKEKRYRLVLEKKQKTSRKQLCKGLPSAFLSYFEYVDGLGYDERPQYTSIINTFKDLYRARGYTDKLFDWEIKK